jgi:hypothetical protein
VRVRRPHVVIISYLGVREHQQAPQGRPDRERIARMRATPIVARESNLRDDLCLLHAASWLRDVVSGVYWQEQDLAFIERRLAPTLHELDWPGERRVQYHEYIAALAELLEEVRADGVTPILLNVPRAPNAPFDPVLDVYQRGAIEVAGWSQTAVLDGRNVFVRAVAEEDIPSQDMFLGDLVPSECGHLSLAQALAEAMLRRRGDSR